MAPVQTEVDIARFRTLIGKEGDRLVVLHGVQCSHDATGCKDHVRRLVSLIEGDVWKDGEPVDRSPPPFFRDGRNRDAPSPALRSAKQTEERDSAASNLESERLTRQLAEGLPQRDWEWRSVRAAYASSRVLKPCL